jgi:hypothetical protein
LNSFRSPPRKRGPRPFHPRLLDARPRSGSRASFRGHERREMQLSNSQASTPVLFEKAPGTPLALRSLTKQVRGWSAETAPQLPRALARHTARPLAIEDAAPFGAPHAGPACASPTCSFAAFFLKAPGPLFRTRKGQSCLIPEPEFSGSGPSRGLPPSFIRAACSRDNRQTLVVGPGGCPGSPGRPGANRTARAPHQPKGVTPPTTRRFGSSPPHLPIRSATDRRRRRPSASRVRACISWDC